MWCVLRTVVLALALCAVQAGRGDGMDSVLLWMVDDGLVYEVAGQVGPVRVSELRSRPDGKSVNYARVQATDGSETVFLDLYAYFNRELHYAGDFTDVSGGYAGPLWADVTGYEDPAWSFMIELGNLDESGDEEVWTTMAYSDRATYADLARFIQPGEIPDPTMTPWTGGQYSVPEPTSGLLVAVGGALLALRRRRRAA